MSTFVEYATEVLSTPRLRGPWGTKWVTAFAAEYDWQKKRLTQSVLVRYPEYAPSDALALIGWERQIQRAPGESSVLYAVRLRDAWVTWTWAGTGPGILAGVASCGFAAPRWNLDDWPTNWPETSEGHVWLAPVRIFATPPDDGDPSQWSRFWVIIDYYAHTGGDVAHVRDDPTFIRGDSRYGTAWGARGTKLSAGEWQTLKRSIRKWRGAGETCFEAIFICSDGGIYDVRGPWWRRGVAGPTRGARLVRGTVGEEGYTES